MTPPEDHEVIRAMRKYGGGFVSALAALADRADDENLRRLKLAWPEEWQKFTELAEMKKGKETV